MATLSDDAEQILAGWVEAMADVPRALDMINATTRTGTAELLAAPTNRHRLAIQDRIAADLEPGTRALADVAGRYRAQVGELELKLGQLREMACEEDLSDIDA